MSKRHNRKRTRSRPRHRDAGKAHSTPSRPNSVDILLSSYPLPPSYIPYPFQSAHIPSAAAPPANHWDRQYSAWQARIRREREQAMEAYNLRFYGGEAGDEDSLCVPMLKVVTDLFNGNIDYEDP